MFDDSTYQCVLRAAEMMSIIIAPSLVICLIAGILRLIIVVTKNMVDSIKSSYKVKHRFDGKLTAKCWCKDCRWHDENDFGRCTLGGVNRYTPDNGFCYEGELIK